MGLTTHRVWSYRFIIIVLLLRQCFCHFCPVFHQPVQPPIGLKQLPFSHVLFGLSSQGKDFVFTFIIEYSSLRDFYRPLDNSLVYFYVTIFER
jgi:hypothetical protein